MKKSRGRRLAGACHFGSPVPAFLIMLPSSLPSPFSSFPCPPLPSLTLPLPSSLSILLSLEFLSLFVSSPPVVSSFYSFLPTIVYCPVFISPSYLARNTQLARMRYENWDVLLFPENSKIPVQEFKTQCFVTKDRG